jgi:hypothetical protein
MRDRLIDLVVFAFALALLFQAMSWWHGLGADGIANISRLTQ